MHLNIKLLSIKRYVNILEDMLYLIQRDIFQIIFVIDFVVFCINYFSAKYDNIVVAYTSKQALNKLF